MRVIEEGRTDWPRVEVWVSSVRPNESRAYMHVRHRNGDITESNNYASTSSAYRRARKAHPWARIVRIDR